MSSNQPPHPVSFNDGKSKSNVNQFLSTTSPMEQCLTISSTSLLDELTLSDNPNHSNFPLSTKEVNFCIDLLYDDAMQTLKLGKLSLESFLHEDFKTDFNESDSTKETFTSLNTKGASEFDAAAAAAVAATASIVASSSISYSHNVNQSRIVTRSQTTNQNTQSKNKNVIKTNPKLNTGNRQQPQKSTTIVDCTKAQNENAYDHLNKAMPKDTKKTSRMENLSTNGIDGSKVVNKKRNSTSLFGNIKEKFFGTISVSDGGVDNGITLTKQKLTNKQNEKVNVNHSNVNERMIKSHNNEFNDAIEKQQHLQRSQMKTATVTTRLRSKSIIPKCETNDCISNGNSKLRKNGIETTKENSSFQTNKNEAKSKITKSVSKVCKLPKVAPFNSISTSTLDTKAKVVPSSGVLHHNNNDNNNNISQSMVIHDDDANKPSNDQDEELLEIFDCSYGGSQQKVPEALPFATRRNMWERRSLAPSFKFNSQKKV